MEPDLRVIIRNLNAYLAGELSPEEVSRWALNVLIRETDWEHWDRAILQAVHALSDLHDGPDTAWAPDRAELETHTNSLNRLAAERGAGAEGRAPPAH